MAKQSYQMGMKGFSQRSRFFDSFKQIAVSGFPHGIEKFQKDQFANYKAKKIPERLQYVSGNPFQRFFNRSANIKDMD